ncbi:MAG: DMT family transporter [Pseudomonadota bacterium]
MAQALPYTSNGVSSALLGATLGTLTVLCWASYNVAAVQGIKAGLQAVDLVLLRFGVAGLILAPALSLLRRRDGTAAGWPSIGRAVVLALLGGPIFGMLAVGGYAFAPLSHGMLFAPAAVFVVGTALAVIVNGERLSGRKVRGGAVVVAGLVVLSGAVSGGIAPGVWRGDLLFIAAGTMWAGFTVLMRRWSIDPLRGTLRVGAVSGLFAPIVYGAAILWGTPSGLAITPFSETLFQAVMQGVVGGVLSIAALMGAARLLGAATAALLPSFTPVVALGLAIPALGDWPSGQEVIGVAIAVVGLSIASARRI